MGDSILLTYGDTTIRKSDLALLDGKFWINDAIISFFYEYLSFQFKHADMLFLQPPTIALVNLFSELELPQLLHPLSLSFPHKQIIFIPINNHVLHFSGTHWSLMIYHRASHAFYHYDSMHGINSDVAESIAKKIKPLFQDKEAKFLNAPSPTQQNGYDCGVYAMKITEFILGVDIEKDKNKEFALKEIGLPISERDITPEGVTEFREKIKQIILKEIK